MTPAGKYPSPGGDYVFHIRSWEARMSHWIESFALVEAASSRPLIAPQDPNWSLDEAVWQGTSLVKLSVRKYPGDHTPSQYEIEADCATLLARVQGGPPIPFTQVERALEVLLRQSPSA